MAVPATGAALRTATPPQVALPGSELPGPNELRRLPPSGRKIPLELYRWVG